MGLYLDYTHSHKLNKIVLYIKINPSFKVYNIEI